MFKLLAKIFGSENHRTLKQYTSKLKTIHSYYNEYKNFEEDQFEKKTQEFRTRYKNGETLDALLPEAFALVQAASERTIGMKHYDVQLIGGMILHNGMVAEMSTGEGKTLVATLPSYLNSLTGNPVHVVTVNDYLAQRDATTMQPLFDLLSTKCEFITSQTPPQERAEKYDSDVLYITNNEIGFDYLRNNMQASLQELTLMKHGLHFAIVDEVDSVLIDEARTPLIISGPVQQSPDLYRLAKDIVHTFTEEDFEIEEKQKSIFITDSGYQKIDTFLHKHGVIAEGESVYNAKDLQLQIRNNHILHATNQALRAQKIMKENADYLVRNKEVVIVDEFTGRIMEGRRYSEGLHQAIEAKHGVPIQQESQTLASITYQNYFRMYQKLAGMTGTAQTEASEFHEIYNLKVVSVPTHKPCIRVDEDDLVYKTEDEKFNAIVGKVKEAHKNGQPVLVGTTSVGKSEKLSALFTQHKLEHSVLNAKYHEKEAEIIADAGKFGSITIATNMAGRGTDIILGGSLERKIYKKTRYIKNDEEKQKVINEIKQEHNIEAQKVKDAGGLFVIGSERHESRRIDNQLRGRSGRQGDIGKSQFFLSLEDDLLRIFGGDKLKSMLGTLGFKEGESIQHSWLNRIILKSQSRIEGQNFEIRKNLIKYDDIINTQRQIIYKKRMALIAEGFDIKTHLQSAVETLYENPSQEVTETLSVIAESNTVQSKEAILQKVEAITDKETLQKAQYFAISILDILWKEHLYTIDTLKQSMNLRSYAQKDPLSEYKISVFEEFQDMLSNYNLFLVKEVFFTPHNNAK